MSIVRRLSRSGAGRARSFAANDREVAFGARAEFPVVVDGHRDAGQRRSERPRRRERRLAELRVDDRGALTGLRAEAERWDDAGDVIRVGHENAWANEPRQRPRRIVVQRIVHVARHDGTGRAIRRGLRVRPRPAVGEVRQLERWLRRRRDVEQRQRRVRARADRHTVLLLHDDETQPRPQLSGGVRRRRCEQPRIVRPVELDAREVARLEVRRPGRRIGANDLMRVDADDVGRAAQPHRHRRNVRLTVDREVRRDVRDAHLRGKRVDHVDRGGGTRADPRHEDQIRLVGGRRWWCSHQNI